MITLTLWFVVSIVMGLVLTLLKVVFKLGWVAFKILLTVGLLGSVVLLFFAIIL